MQCQISTKVPRGKYFWGLIDEDCPEIVMEWLLRSYNVLKREEVNKSSGSTSMNMFVNPYYKFINASILDVSYKWCLDVSKSSRIDPRYIVSETGPTDENPRTYSPILLYLIGKNSGVKFNKSIMDVNILHHIVSTRHTIGEISNVTEFSPDIGIESYKSEDLETFAERLGYDKKRRNPGILYSFLTKMYMYPIFKFEGCVCVTNTSFGEFYYTEEDIITSFINHENFFLYEIGILNNDQISQLIYICKKYRLNKLYDFIKESIKNTGSSLVIKEKFNNYINALSGNERLKISQEIKRLKTYVDSLIRKGLESEIDISRCLFEINDIKIKLSQRILDLSVVNEDVIGEGNISTLLDKMREGDKSTIINLVETLEFYGKLV